MEYECAMLRCPHGRKEIAEAAGKCPHCCHDLDKHVWLLASLEPGAMRRRLAWTGLAAIILLLMPRLLHWL